MKLANETHKCRMEILEGQLNRIGDWYEENGNSFRHRMSDEVVTLTDDGWTYRNPITEEDLAGTMFREVWTMVKKMADEDEARWS